MSFDEYERHISQKYRLAVAISVIKTKPNNVTVEDYLLQLQKKIIDFEFDPNETVCSDDFNFDDDDISHEKNQHNTHIEKSKFNSDETRLEYAGNDNDSQCSQTILNDFVFGGDIIESPVSEENTIRDTIRILKEVSTDVQEKPNVNQNLSQSTFCESQEALNVNNDITYCGINNNIPIQNEKENNDHIDTQETELYTLHGFTQNYTHVSQSQGDYFVISDKYIHNAAIGNVHNTTEYRNEDMQILHNASQNLFTQNDFTSFDDRVTGDINVNPHQFNDIDNAQTNAQSFKFFVPNIPKICVNDKVNDGNKTIEIVTTEVNNVEKANNDQTLQFNIQNAFVREEFTRNSDETRGNTNNDISNAIGMDIENIKDFNNTDLCSIPLFSLDSQKTGIYDVLSVANDITKNSNDRLKDNNINSKDNQDFAKVTPGNSKELNVNDANDQEMDVDETESDDNHQERVPFKVLEELNRVKTYLNRKDRDRRNNDGHLTDSGYRSDSQSRSSLKSASQACGAWLNQSAFCLLNHLIQTVRADDIDKEIALVLGQLIDKLHDEENYPPFLEKMLETVDGLMDDISIGACAEDVLITKDENIQRLLLLNRSKHILRHTIEKITNILEKLYTNLTQESLYELTNIVDVENACYIFHILETFLKRYVKIKDTSSQTQTSQEEFPKRSSLIELWRKKWNPHCKEIIKNDNKICVLKRSREILNKIIVECMDGYSLVAFAALQCFNLIQG